MQCSAFEYLLPVQRAERASVVVLWVGGFLQLMHCVVGHRAVLQAIAQATGTGEQRLFRVLEPLGPRIVDEAELRTFGPQLLTLFDVNTPEDAARTRRADR